MEIIIGAVIIIVLLLFLGVRPMTIIAGIVVLFALGAVLMTGFFAVSLVLMLLAKPVRVDFLRIEQNEGPGSHAVYRIGEREYDNAFPAEMILQDRIYRRPTVYARLLQGKKRYFLFDWYTVIIILVGLPVSAGLTAGFLWGFLLLREVMSFM
ncbi:MAG: hypothetical protein IJ055_01930 [Oscillospiraceae bacterium]|nr:hypothetical protein [Oscillospiraceae bacterium]